MNLLIKYWMSDFRLRLQCLPLSTAIQCDWSTVLTHLAIHAACDTMNASKTLNCPASIRSTNQMYSSLISKNGNKHWNCALKVAPTGNSSTKTICTNITKRQTANCADMILTCHFWNNPFQIIWATSIFSDHAPNCPFMKGKTNFNKY